MSLTLLGGARTGSAPCAPARSSTLPGRSEVRSIFLRSLLFVAMPNGAGSTHFSTTPHRTSDDACARSSFAVPPTPTLARSIGQTFCRSSHTFVFYAPRRTSASWRNYLGSVTCVSGSPDITVRDRAAGMRT
jgi:hypothetical protein